MYFFIAIVSLFRKYYYFLSSLFQLYFLDKIGTIDYRKRLSNYTIYSKKRYTDGRIHGKNQYFDYFYSKVSIL